MYIFLLIYRDVLGPRVLREMSLQDLSQLLFNGFGNLERLQSTGSWQTLSQFSRGAIKTTLVITGLSVSLPVSSKSYGEDYFGSY